MTAHRLFDISAPEPPDINTAKLINTAMLGPFDFVNAINQTKEALITDEETERAYNPYLANLALSYFQDTVLFANEMNNRPHTPKKIQFEYLRSSVRRRKRYAKWHKKTPNADVELIQRIYKFNRHRAEQTLRQISPDDLAKLRDMMESGGVKTGKS